jgi:NDP-sugar pyrophosphorylase family protein
MKMAIIAAGLGERMTSGGIATPKPLIPIWGRPLVARIIDAAATLRASSVACIVNDVNPQVERFLRTGPWRLPVELVVKTTPSSMESLFSLEHLLQDEPFLLFTVDVVFSIQTIHDFLGKARMLNGAKGALALTDHVDDEKPLWVAIDETNRITGIGDAAKGTPFITSGFYYFFPEVFRLIPKARRMRLGALRQFLGLIIDEGIPLCGIPVAKTLDVDYPADIEKAEVFVKEIETA